ncbi:P-loop containing nucleoside triphosphate hydrolase protein [Mycena galopus ATCC 62051]|nr:P-loop containing nucleoside triphosphate hydrolase protein [Mycena galopus ATCC 62051]
MKQFRKGKIRTLVATEAAGMGADIPDIELVIQFGVPSSLAVWTQRAGRAGRFPGLQARAIMLVEKSMFRQQKPRKGGPAKAGAAAAPPPEPPPEPEVRGAADSDSSSDDESDPNGSVAAARLRLARLGF